jgi:hypothetical protein
LRAHQGETFIYAWWFFLSSTLQPADSFFHIFQLKASGDGVNGNPTMTFGLRKSNGFDVYFGTYSTEHCSTYEKMNPHAYESSLYREQLSY